MSALSTNRIYEAISCLEREANFRRNIGGNDNWERARDLSRAFQDASQELRILSDALPRLRELKAEADRQYDRYVTRVPEGCSCHISPPCSYCTRDDGEASDA